LHYKTQLALNTAATEKKSTPQQISTTDTLKIPQEHNSRNNSSRKNTKRARSPSADLGRSTKSPQHLALAE